MTHAPDPTPTSDAGALDSRDDGARRGPVKQIKLLLPVWGEQFIVQFLRVSMPTLVAPGNLPAVAAALPCTLVFLTNTEGAQLMRTHPATVYLQSICNIEFDIIDDLITGDNYSTTLTLAYARAIRATGEMTLGTCFFFLISDYIMADGSLANVLARIRAGHNGVLAGNFQVVEEDAKKTLFRRFDSDEPSMVISSRDLMAWAMNHLHPMTLANTVNFPLYCSSHSNRLFWQVDENTLIGRFYLMHMIAIRPETMDFQIGSSCDYSFVSEMCPSGNVHVMTDSDEYFVVEMQPRSHENKFIHLGAINRADLVNSLAEWTTTRHRINAHSVVVYHAGDFPGDLKRIVNESREFIEAIEAVLPPAQPFRDHPYWIGAIAAHRREVIRKRQQLQKLKPVTLSDDDDGEPPRPTYHDLLFKLRDMFFGRPPQVRPWHPRQPDYKMIEKLAAMHITNKEGGRSLVLSSMGTFLDGWLRMRSRNSDSIDMTKLMAYTVGRYERLIGRYDGCLLILSDNELPRLRPLLKRALPLLSRGDKLLIFVINGQGMMVGRQFNQEILHEATSLFDRRFLIEDIQFVMAGRAAWTAQRGMRNLFILSLRSPIHLVLSVLPIAGLVLFSLVGNFLGRKVAPQPQNDGLCSSVGIVIRVVADGFELPELTEYTELELAGHRFEARAPRASTHRVKSV